MRAAQRKQKTAPEARNTHRTQCFPDGQEFAG